MQAGMKPLDAVDRAVSLVVAQQGSLFSPLVVGAVHRERAAIRTVLAAERPGVPVAAKPENPDNGQGTHLRLA
jgi:hypothetical protein